MYSCTCIFFLIHIEALHIYIFVHEHYFFPLTYPTVQFERSSGTKSVTLYCFVSYVALNYATMTDYKNCVTQLKNLKCVHTSPSDFDYVVQPQKWWSQGNNGSNIISIFLLIFVG